MELTFNSSAYYISSDRNITAEVDEKNLPFDLDKVSSAIIEKFVEELRKELKDG